MLRETHAAALAAALALATARPAPAQPFDRARCTVQVISAIETEKKPQGGPELDPKIEALRPYLSKAPFTAWQKFSLNDEKSFEMSLKETQKFQLPGGKPIALTVLEHLPDKHGAHRLRVQLEVGHPGKRQLSTVFAVPEGKVVLQVLQESLHKERALLVIGTACGEAKAPGR